MSGKSSQYLTEIVWFMYRQIIIWFFSRSFGPPKHCTFKIMLYIAKLYDILCVVVQCSFTKQRNLQIDFNVWFLENTAKISVLYFESKSIICILSRIAKLTRFVIRTLALVLCQNISTHLLWSGMLSGRWRKTSLSNLILN